MTRDAKYHNKNISQLKKDKKMEIMTLRETADYLKISYGHLWDLVKNGGNHPPYIMVGKTRRFTKEQVNEWVKLQSSK